jgi:putative endonuclease
MTMADRKNNSADGLKAEALAAEFLARQGLEVLERNFCVKGGNRGEIDLVARQGELIVFVEVRLRRSGAFGGAAFSITKEKQRKLAAAARHWLAQHGLQPCRFDCVLLPCLSMDAIEWIPDAFQEP